MKCVKEGLEVKVVCMTKGEAGKSVNKLGENDSLALVRSREFDKAAALLGVTDYVIEDFGDGKLESNIGSMHSYLEALVLAYKPDYVLTLEPCGIYGHPDHIALTKVIDGIYEGAKSLGQHADANFNASFKLIYATVSKDEVFRRVRNEMAKNPGNVAPAKPNVILVLSVFEIRRKLKAFFSHKSQFKFSPLFFVRWTWRGLLNKEFFAFRDSEF